MKSIYPILIGFAVSFSALGQDSADEPNQDELVKKAIDEFNRLRGKNTKPEKEVVVVLPAPGSESDSVEADPPAAIPVEEPADAEGEPELVTGIPPVEEPAEEPEPEEDVPPVVESVEPLESEPQEQRGLGIRVEAIRDGSGKSDPGQVQLKASFAAKSLSSAPSGWILEKSDQAPALNQEVTLRPGKTISLSIRPHVLTPDADGANTFAVVEPGFDVAEGYRQTNTVSAILSNSVAQLDRDALLLGNAITDLHQLLASLPKPEPKESPNP